MVRFLSVVQPQPDTEYCIKWNIAEPGSLVLLDGQPIIKEISR